MFRLIAFCARTPASRQQTCDNKEGDLEFHGLRNLQEDEAGSPGSPATFY